MLGDVHDHHRQPLNHPVASSRFLGRGSPVGSPLKSMGQQKHQGMGLPKKTVRLIILDVKESKCFKEFSSLMIEVFRFERDFLKL